MSKRTLAMTRLACVFSVCVSLALLMVTPAAIASEVTTPAVGSAERTAVLDAARAPVEAELGVAIRFVIDQLRVVDDWAFVLGRPVGIDGEPVDYSATAYAEAIEEGMFEDSAAVLLLRKRGRWHAVTHVIGATDVPWIGWDAEFGAPSAVLPASD